MLEAITLAEIMLSQQPDTVGGGQGPKTGLKGDPTKVNEEAEALKKPMTLKIRKPAQRKPRSTGTGVGGEKKETKVGLKGN